MFLAHTHEHFSYTTRLISQINTYTFSLLEVRMGIIRGGWCWVETIGLQHRLDWKMSCW